MNSFPVWPVFADDERRAVDDVLASGQVNYWTGSQCRLFEQEFAAYLGRNHGISLANGTLALELALEAFGIGPGDEVITSCWTFIASASCAVARGAQPVLADVDPISRNITAQTIAPLITSRTKAIICVHLVGWPCDMEPIMDLAHKHELVVIEDCAQAHGARYKGRPIGSWGHAAAFSFCQDKIMTTGGEGGLLLVDDQDAFERAWAYKDHGKTWALMHPPQTSAGFRFVHESFGTNWRMTEMQAAIGRLQLAKLDQWVAQRRANAQILIDGLSSLPGVEIQVPDDDYFHAYYKFYLTLNLAALAPGWNQERVITEIRELGIPCMAGICPEIYREQAFLKSGRGPQAPLPVAADLGQRSLLLLVHPTLTQEHMQQMVQAVEQVILAATRS